MGIPIVWFLAQNAVRDERADARPLEHRQPKAHKNNINFDQLEMMREEWEENPRMHQSEVEDYKLEHMEMHNSIVQRDGLKFRVEEESGYMETEYERPNPPPIHKLNQAPVKNKTPAVTINTYDKSDGAWWEKIFCCCTSKNVEPQFEDCGQCERRVYKEESESSEEEPYISHQRMKQREKQSINIFYDRISNNRLLKNTWE